MSRTNKIIASVGGGILTLVIATSFAFASTTISTDINTAGNLTVAGTSTLNNLTVSGTSTLTNLIVNNTSTSTFNQGINLTSGCFAVSGSCLSSGNGSSASVTLASTTDITSALTLSMWGDSLTDGSGGGNASIAYFLLNSGYLNPTFTNAYDMGFSGQTSSYIANRFLSSPWRWGDFVVLWPGQNDGPSATSTILAYTQQMVAAIPSPQHYLVMGVEGQVGYTTLQKQQIEAYNTSLGTTYFPGHYFDVRSFLKTMCNPIGSGNTTNWYASTTQDQIDCANDDIPTSVRVDIQHLTANSYQQVAKAIAPLINAMVTLQPNTAVPAYTSTQLSQIAKDATDYYSSSTLDDYFLARGGQYRYIDTARGFSGGLMTGSKNLSIGPMSTVYLTSGSNNTSVGYQTGTNLSTGSNNTLLGYLNGWQLTTGGYNTIIGQSSGGNLTSGNSNVVIGNNTLASLSTGGDTVGIGEYAGYSFNGSYGVFLGEGAGQDSTGNGNMFIGSYAGHASYAPSYTLLDVTTGQNDTFLGNNSSVASTSIQVNNSTAIGYQSVVNCSNCMTLGGTGTYAVNVGIGSSSPISALDIASSTGTTTMTIGTTAVAKGSCLKLFRTDGTPIYAYIAAGATTFTLTTTPCASGLTGF